jgi:outer membrane lipoprotein-sorting protein
MSKLSLGPDLTSRVRRSLFTLLALVVAGAMLFSAIAEGAVKELTVDELRKIQEDLKSYDALTVDFTQTTITAISKLRGKADGRKREGKAVLAKPNRFKWMLETPTRDHKLYDGKFFYEIDPATSTAKRYSVTGPQAYEVRQIVDLVLNFNKLLQTYDLKKAEQDGDLVKIQLTPKTEQEITALELHLSTKDSYVTFLKWDLKNKSSLAHAFRNPNRGAIPDDAFDLPKGVKITDSN